VDLILFNGSLEDLYKFANAEVIRDQPQTPQRHTVVAGDSFESIANKYGVTVRELVGANPQLLKTGEQLTVPVGVAIPSESGGSSGSVGSGPSSPQRTHTVKPAENLTLIAVKYGTTVAAIASANNITNINNISVGQVLIIP
jgi:peptidoglycan-N-acetylglucosamine deacetylase